MAVDPKAAAPATPVTPAASATLAEPAAAVVLTPDAAPAAGAEPAQPAKGYWPDGWQARIAGDDKDELKQISRYASPEAVWQKARALEKRMSSGEFKAVLPKDPKPEELAAWRKDNGIPAKPDGYDLKGLKIPKEDEEIIGGFLKNAHDANFTPQQTRIAVEGYYAENARKEQARGAKDEEERHAALDSLNQEWGAQFRRNVNMVEGLLSKFPEKVRDALKSARLPDGTALFNNPDALRGFVSLALELNPAGIVVPAGGGDLGKGALDEYKDIQKFMREHRADYNKDAAKQARMTELIEYLAKNDLIDAQGNEVAARKRAA